MSYQIPTIYPRTVYEPAKNDISGFQIPPRFYTLDLVRGEEYVIPWPNEITAKNEAEGKPHEQNIVISECLKDDTRLSYNKMRECSEFITSRTSQTSQQGEDSIISIDRVAVLRIRQGNTEVSVRKPWRQQSLKRLKRSPPFESLSVSKVARRKKRCMIRRREKYEAEK